VVDGGNLLAVIDENLLHMCMLAW